MSTPWTEDLVQRTIDPDSGSMPQTDRFLLEKQLEQSEGADLIGYLCGSVEAAVEACAKEVEAAGCHCIPLWIQGEHRGAAPFDGKLSRNTKIVIRHDSRCPTALATKLRGLARFGS